MNINMSSFYSHQNFMRDVRQGEKIIVESERKLRTTKRETTDIKVGDTIVATELATYLKGTKGKVLEIYHEGPFLRFKIQWEVSKTPTFERASDVTLI